MKEEKPKVGRPKLADEALIKDSWCRLGASLATVFVLTICGIGTLTNRTPLEVLTFRTSKSVASVAQASNTRVIKANKAKTIEVGKEGTKTKKVRIIPANKSKEIKIKK